MSAVAVASGPQALELLDSRRFDLVILDPARIAVDLLDSVRRRNAHIPVIVLSARGRGDDAAQCEQWNAARVTKPIRPSELRACIEGALGIRCAGLESLAASVVAPAAAGAPLRILLAEDNPVNQKVAGRMLERSGYQVEIVSDGGLAVGARQSGTFDLILMDVQMPHLDGLEATRVIRNWEAQTGHPRIPIIAMTAHAMAGDRDRCLKPGMDGYVSKPIQKKALLEAIAAVACDPTGSVAG